MSKIPDWALGENIDVEPGVIVRHNPDTTIDEVFIKGADFHLEQMDDGQYWIGLSWIDDAGAERMQHIMLTRHGKHIFPTLYR